jgi:hypothetical protein
LGSEQLVQPDPLKMSSRQALPVSQTKALVSTMSSIQTASKPSDPLLSLMKTQSSA